MISCDDEIFHHVMHDEIFRKRSRDVVRGNVNNPAVIEACDSK